MQQEVYVMENLSKTMDSMHLKRLAIDINFFKDDYRLFSDKNKKDEDFEMIKLAGEYWQDLHQDNQAGMFWQFFDPSHFEHRF